MISLSERRKKDRGGEEGGEREREKERVRERELLTIDQKEAHPSMKVLKKKVQRSVMEGEKRERGGGGRWKWGDGNKWRRETWERISLGTGDSEQ